MIVCQSAPPASAPEPRLTARSMLSLGTEVFLAFWIASYSVGFPPGSPPPIRAATSMFLISLANDLARRASTTAFWCLVVAHLECPDMCVSLHTGGQARAAPSAGGLPGDDHGERAGQVLDSRHRLPAGVPRRCRLGAGEEVHLVSRSITEPVVQTGRAELVLGVDPETRELQFGALERRERRLHQRFADPAAPGGGQYAELIGPADRTERWMRRGGVEDGSADPPVGQCEPGPVGAERLSSQRRLPRLRPQSSSSPTIGERDVQYHSDL